MHLLNNLCRIAVLNLIINGLPSIPNSILYMDSCISSFKPYYKWITFNTIYVSNTYLDKFGVLNLIINGLPSIQKTHFMFDRDYTKSFKPYYKWITFNT